MTPKDVNSMNKILIATNALPPVIGGLENITHDIATYLSHPDKSVTVLVSKKPLEGYKDRKYNVLYLKSITLFKRLPIPLPTFSNIEILFNLRKEYFDAILLQSHLFVSNWLVAVTVDKFNNMIWLNYGGGYVSHRSRIISSLIRFYEKFGWALLNSKSTCVLSQSEKSAIRFESLSGRKSNVIGNCVPNELIELEPIKYSGNSFKKFLFVGRLVEDKGIMSLLSIYADCIQSLVEDGVLPLGKLQLTIVGDGPLSSKISKFLEARPEISYRPSVSQLGIR